VLVSKQKLQSLKIGIAILGEVVKFGNILLCQKWHERVALNL
jgi:hypothetical protein